MRLVLVFIACGAHMLALFQFEMQKNTAYDGSYFRLVFLALLGVSFLLALGVVFIRDRKWAALFLWGRAFIALYIGGTVGNRFGVEFSLLITLVVDIISYYPLLKGIIFAVCFTAAAILVQPSATVLGLTVAVPYLDHRISFGAYAALISIVASLLKFQRENQVSVVELNRRLDEATVELARTNMKLQEYAISAEQEALSNERRRLAREIHDTLAYTLTNLIMMMEAAIDMERQGKEDLPRHLALARDQAKTGLAEVRNAVNALRPTQLINMDGLLAIHRLVIAFERATQIKVRLEMADAPLFFGDAAGLAVFRLVQEGLTNALRHGRANEIGLFFSKAYNGLYIKVEDNGVGSAGNGPPSGYGLVGMRERIEQLGGHLEVSSAPGLGFTLTAWIPLQE